MFHVSARLNSKGTAATPDFNMPDFRKMLHTEKH